MERRGFPKPKRSRAWWFRVQFEDRGYQCTDERGSLKPGCRQELYCPRCDAPECVWGGLTFKQVQAGAKPVEQKVVSREKRQKYSEAAKRNARKKRAEGLAPSGKPLASTCWNCTVLRQNGHNSFICKLRPLDQPVGEWVVRQRTAERVGCGSFDMRLVMEIRKLGRE